MWAAAASGQWAVGVQRQARRAAPALHRPAPPRARCLFSASSGAPARDSRPRDAPHNARVRQVSAYSSRPSGAFGAGHCKKITNPNFSPNRSRVVCRVKCERGAEERYRGKCISRWCKAQAVRAGGGACDDGHRIDFYLPAPPLLWRCRARHRSLHRLLN